MKVLLIPHDLERDCEVHDMPESFESLATLCFHEGDRYFDFITFREQGFQVLVDDIGLLRTPPEPLNARATGLTLGLGYWSGSPLIGNVLVIGVDEVGEWVDVPEDLAEMAVTEREWS